MTYKELFDDAFGTMKSSGKRMTDKEFADTVRNMSRPEESSHISEGWSSVRVVPDMPRTERKHSILKITAGIAGTAAVLAGAVFGLKFLNEHGGLKGPDVQGAGAGYSASTQKYPFADATGYVSIDQRYDVGDDLTVHLKGYKFDGTLARIYYDIIYKEVSDDGMPQRLILPKDSDIGHHENCQIGGSGTLFSCFADYRFNEPTVSADVTFCYRDEKDNELFSLTMYKSTDMIDEPIVTTNAYMTTPPVEATTATTVLPDSSDADTTTSYEAELKELNDIKAYYENELKIYENAKEETALEIASLNQRKEALTSELTRLQSLGEDTGTVEQKLRGVEESINKQEIMLESYSSKAEQTYDKLAVVKLDIAKIEAEKKKYKFFEFSSEETEVTAETTVIMNIPDDASRNGYYEGEEALEVMKQYAGEDYCFPLENWTKAVINYRTRDEWTGDTSTDYRFNIPAESGEPILAVTGGTVIETFSRNVPGQGEGIYVTIQASDGRKWRYSHLSDCYVSEGDSVKAGDKIAAVGATGWCTGPLVCISFPDSEVIDPAETTE